MITILVIRLCVPLVYFLFGFSSFLVLFCIYQRLFIVAHCCDYYQLTFIEVIVSN